MKIAIIGPIARNAVEKLLAEPEAANLPEGYYGHPFFGTLIAELLRLGHEVVAITTSRCYDGNLETQRFSSNKFEWIVVPSRPHAMKAKWGKVGRMVDFYAFERKQMLKALMLSKPDVVNAHWAYEFTSVAIASGLPRVITVHDHHWKVVWYNRGFYWFARALMAEWNYLKLKRVTTVSTYMVPFLIKKVKEVIVIPNPVTSQYNLSDINISIQQKSECHTAPVIAMINNGWSGRKNGKFGLEVFSNLLKILPNARLHLIGHGSEPKGEAFNDAESLGIQSSITFHGSVKHDQVLPLLKGAHFLMHTAKEESFGVVLAEAAISGTPAIGYFKAGAVPWVIGNDTLLYKAWDAPVVAQQIFSLLKNPGTYAELALNAYREALKRFSVEKVASQYIEEYYGAMEKGTI